MIKKTLINILLTASIFICSCVGFHKSGTLNNSALLSSNNFTYVKTNIQGSSTIKYFAIWGGIDKPPLVSSAKQAMLQQSPLKDNQALTNVVVDYVYSVYILGIYRKVTCTVTADVVEFR